jgi:cytidine deaminase
MTTKSFSTTWTEYLSLDEMEISDRELVVAAREAAENAYAPYSKFKVGAAIRLETGMIVKGANIENAAFPSGICAERAAFAHSASNFPNVKPVAIAVAAYTAGGLTEEPVSPCGNCRQVLAEEEFRNETPIRVILSGKSKYFVIEKGADLLPLQFNRNSLKISAH